MDIYCRNCGEPWDNDTLHDVANELGTTYDKIAREFSRTGCKALACDEYGDMARCISDGRSSARGMVAELLGEDLDGYSSMIEDMEYAGLL